MDLLSILADQRAELSTFDPSAYVTRKEEQYVNLQSSRAQVIIGVRRSGKSTLCKKVLVQSDTKFAFVNFDDERLASLKAEQLNEILQTLYQLYGNFTHILFDEIQNIVEWPLFVNRLLRQGIRLIITGSNANLLSGELITHLTGRHKQITLFPFSFEEFCIALNIDHSGITTKAKGFRQGALDRYLVEGGFPETLRDTPEEADEYAKSLLQTIIAKDICRRYKIKFRTAIDRLANTLLDHCCQIVSVRQLTEELGIKSVHTVDNYLTYLENAYLILTIKRFSYKSLERRLSAKAYTADNAFLSHHDDALQSENLGWRLENVIALELMRRVNRPSFGLYYLRKSKDYEVDFLITEGIQVKELIQVTYDFCEPTRKLYNREVGGLLKGAKETHCNNLTLIIMKGNPQTIEVEGKKIRIVRASDWLVGL